MRKRRQLPTLHKSFAFLVLLVVLTIIEEAVVGLFHQQSVAASLGELTGAKLYETLAGYIIMLLVLIPYIARGVLDEALGEGRLTRIFLSIGGGLLRHPAPLRPDRAHLEPHLAAG
jgi:hypothetical protein